MTPFLFPAAFAAGLAAVGWIAAGYLHTSPLALAMTLAIGAFFVLGAAELQRSARSVRTLAQALRALDATPASAEDWLATLPAPLRPAVAARLDGVRAALPGPSLAPALTGLLVLLGMLGTFLGMVVTLRGTGLALEQATDLATMRDSLAAPVKGLGLAFGTSVAGVAASAMLGLMGALARRERLAAADLLAQRVAGVLKPFTAAQRRAQAQQQAAQRLQRQLDEQAALLPALVDALRSSIAQQGERQAQLHEALQAGQARFHAEAGTAYRALAEAVAGSLEQGLSRTLADSARLTADAIAPVVEATLGGIARETAALQAGLAAAVQAQLEATTTRFDASSREAAAGWHAALAAQAQREQAQEARQQALAQRLEDTLAGFGTQFEQRSAALVERVAALQAGTQAALAERADTLLREAEARRAQLDDAAGRQLEAIAARLDRSVEQVGQGWQQAQARQQADAQALVAAQQQALAGAAEALERQSATLLERLAERDEQRLAAWRERLDAGAAALQRQWQLAGEQSLAQQQQICRTLEETATRIGAQAEAHAAGTIGEVARLVALAAEAPRAAAELVGQLREKLADSLARDTAMLAERERMMATLHTLLEALQRAGGEQRAAIDALVGGSAELLERIGQRFDAQVEAGAVRLADAATQAAAGAIEVGALGEAFGSAVQRFDAAGEKLVGQLQKVEATLGRSIARSDEQLAYYVAQAREVIDLSLAAQKQVVDDLQRLASRLPADSEA